MTTMEREKKGGGIHAIGEKKVLIEKVKNLIILSERQGKWIWISDSNLNNKSNKDFLFPVLLNTIIERNQAVSELSPQVGVLLSSSMYMFDKMDIFVQVRKGKTLAKLVNMEMPGWDRAEDRDLLTPHHVRGKIRDRTIRAGNPLGSCHKPWPRDSRNNEKCIFLQSQRRHCSES